MRRVEAKHAANGTDREREPSGAKDDRAVADIAVAVADITTPPLSLSARLIKRAWWAHSGFALVFGVGVMIYSRSGLRYADKLLIALGCSWLLMFVALRFIVGPANRKEVETLTRKGVRLATNYVIKQFYQQMFFFLVPLYASSATWSTASWNWWMAPILLTCAVVSTLDLVFDNVIMERRWLASAMYGLAMFGLLNVMLPLVAGSDHLAGLMVAAGATPLAVALLSFSLKQVFSASGLLLTAAATGALLLATSAGRVAIPPAPLAMQETAVGHGSFGSYECMPASKRRIPADQLDGLRCGSLLLSPGGVREPIEHRYLHDGVELYRARASEMSCDSDGEDSVVLRSVLPSDRVPPKPEGRWQCATYTESGQLVGVRRFQVVATTPSGAAPTAPTAPTGPP